MKELIPRWLPEKNRSRVSVLIQELPSSQKTELLLFVAQSLREEQAPLPEPRALFR